MGARPARRERLRARLEGDRVLRAERAQWGFATPTRILTLASGRRIVIQLDPNASAWRAPEGARVFRDAGLPVPTCVARLPRRGTACLVWEFVRGTAGANLMDGPRATSLARRMGQVYREIVAVRDPRVPADPAWRSPGALRIAAGRWLASEGARALTPAAGPIVDRVVARGWKPAVTHGDYVPANVLVAGRRITAVLDLGDVALRHPLADAAWWSLIVAYHHGSDFVHLETAFLEGAGLAATREQRGQLADLAALRALQLVAARRRVTTDQLRLVAAAVRRTSREGPGN